MPNPPINVRVSRGSYDFLHPSDKQIHISIQHPSLEERLNLLFPEDAYAELGRDDLYWDELVELALEMYIKGTLWGSNLSIAKALLARMEENSDEGSNLCDDFFQAFATRRLTILDRHISEIKGEQQHIRDRMEEIVYGKRASDRRASEATDEST